MRMCVACSTLSCIASSDADAALTPSCPVSPAVGGSPVKERRLKRRPCWPARFCSLVAERPMRHNSPLTRLSGSAGLPTLSLAAMCNSVSYNDNGMDGEEARRNTESGRKGSVAGPAARLRATTAPPFCSGRVASSCAAGALPTSAGSDGERQMSMSVPRRDGGSSLSLHSRAELLPRVCASPRVLPAVLS